MEWFFPTKPFRNSLNWFADNSLSFCLFQNIRSTSLLNSFKTRVCKMCKKSGVRSLNRKTWYSGNGSGRTETPAPAPAPNPCKKQFSTDVEKIKEKIIHSISPEQLADYFICRTGVAQSIFAVLLKFLLSFIVLYIHRKLFTSTARAKLFSQSGYRTA